jgi:hypothetical protein
MVMRKGRISERKMMKSLKPAKAASANAKWLQVLNSESEVSKTDGASKVVSGTYNKKELFFLLVRWQDQLYTVSESCGRCKFPMINCKVSDHFICLSCSCARFILVCLS